MFTSPLPRRRRKRQLFVYVCMSAYSAQPSTQSLMAKHTIIPSLGIQTQCKGHGVVSISDAFIQIQWFLVDVQFERVLSSTWDIRVSPERHQKPIEPEKRSQEMGNKSCIDSKLATAPSTNSEIQPSTDRSVLRG